MNKTPLTGIFRSHLTKSTGIYILSTMVNASVPFLLLPVLTRYLTPVDYGIIAMYSLLVGFFTPFIGLNLHGAISVRYFQVRREELPKYIGNCLFILLLSLAAVGLVTSLAADEIFRWTTFPASWIWTVTATCAAQIVILILMSLWQVENQPILYGTLQVLQTILNLSLSLLLVVWAGRQWQGRVEANLSTALLFMGVSLVLLKKRGSIRMEMDWADIRHALGFGIPLIPHAIGGMIIIYTDRLFLTNMIDIGTTGIYTVGAQIALVLELLHSSFNKAYVPWLYDALSRRDEERQKGIIRLTYGYFASSLALSVAFSLVARPLLRIFVGPSFTEAHQFVFWFSMGFAFSGMYYMVAPYLFYVGKTHLLSWVTMVTAGTNIILNFVLIRANGAVGAAQASAVAFCLSFVLTWIASAKVFPMPWGLSKWR